MAAQLREWTPPRAVAAQLAPSDIEAEEFVLGSILLDGHSLNAVASFLKPAHFYRDVHRWVYAAALGLHQAQVAVEYLTLKDALERSDHPTPTPTDTWGIFLAGLLQNAVTSVHIVHYARIVERDSIRRGLIQAAGDLATLAYSSDDLPALLDQAQALVMQATERTGDGELVKAARIVEDVAAWLDSPTEPGLSTGLVDLDAKIGGLKPKELYIVAGRPAMGKTAMVLGIAAHFARCGQGVAVFSLEMGKEAVIRRMMAQEGRINLHRLENKRLRGDELERAYRAFGEIESWPLYVDETARIGPSELKSRARQLHARRPLSLVVIDYLQLMCRTPDNRVGEIGVIAQALKDLSKDLEVPVLCAAQLSRAVEYRGEKRPVLADLRDSGEIEQAADQVWFPYRDAYYNPPRRTVESGLTEPNTFEVVELIIAKHRNGPTGTVELSYKADEARFGNLARGEE